MAISAIAVDSLLLGIMNAHFFKCFNICQDSCGKIEQFHADSSPCPFSQPELQVDERFKPQTLVHEAVADFHGFMVGKQIFFGTRGQFAGNQGSGW